MRADTTKASEKQKPGNKKGRKAGGKTRFPGLVANAAALNVTPTHLWRCLTGQRKSARLSKAYQDLKSSQKTASKLTVNS